MSAGMPETFVELCQRTASECSVSLTGPSDTTTQTGRLGQIVKWVQAAWLDIQTKHDNWLFMVGSFTVDTTASDGKYAYTDCTDTATATAIANFRSWRLEPYRNTFKIYLTSAGSGTETDLVALTYDEWYRRYNIGAQSDSYPRYVAVHPDRSFLLGAKPDGIYTVSGEYMKSATAMSGDTNVPAIPAEYRMAIVYRAMMKYGRFNAAPEVFNDGQAEYNRMLAEMRRTQLPKPLQASPLA